MALNMEELQRDYTTVDGTECGYLLRVFFQTRPVL
jgi:hypothetical protein